MTTDTMHAVGATITFEKQISEADVALFGLLADDHLPTVEDTSSLETHEHSPVPNALVAALLAGAAARHAGGLANAALVREQLSFAATAFTGDTLTVVAAIAGYDAASHLLRVHAHCANQEGRRLAEGTFDLLAASA
jgi:acyl dehydratase